MKIEQLLDFHEQFSQWDIGVICLNEVFDTKIPIDNWKTINDRTTHGYIEIDGLQFVIIIENLSYSFNDQIIPFLNVAFANIDDSGQLSQELTFNNVSPSKIIGAVTNGIHDYVVNRPEQFVVFSARDHVEQRMRIYQYIAGHMGDGFLTYKPLLNLPDGGKACVMWRNNNQNKKVLDSFFKYIETLTK